ncbi:hypothetical protein [Rhizosphaericola mali]|uniref:Uncharacterized protein n=1 Tax=Rhizosphaericola mali TaxID=2545455 RepID=A0A5P2FZX4_9BACT|nr:hypothetical protein [Rhizosphaericola mali]QES87419.1 hypothetical protein E0W69_001655 [Rhizosphaericola mali]
MKAAINLIIILLFLAPKNLRSQINDSISTKENQKGTFNSSFSLNRSWSPDEFQIVIDSLNAHFNDKNFHPPILENNDSSILNKLTTFKEYWFLENSLLKPKDKISAIMQIYKPLSVLMSNYYRVGNSKNGKLVYEKEISSLGGIIFKFTISQFKQFDNFFSDSIHPTEIQLDGLKKMLHGTNTMLAGYLIIFEKDYNQFSNSSICEMCKSFQELFDFMYSREDIQTKLEFNKRIKLLKKNSTFFCIREILKNK